MKCHIINVWSDENIGIGIGALLFFCVSTCNNNNKQKRNTKYLCVDTHNKKKGTIDVHVIPFTDVHRNENVFKPSALIEEILF